MPKLVIKATKFSDTPEAMEIFRQRGWQRIIDQTTIPSNRKPVSKDKHSTPLMDVDVEEWEYDGE